MFSEIFDNYDWNEIKEKIYGATEKDVRYAINSNSLDEKSIYPLFSPAADSFLEEIAKKSYNITRMRFGNIIQLYTPLYISNECTNSCLYCGFNKNNDITRITLSIDQIKAEAKIIKEMGFDHILLLTGEHTKAVSVEMLAEIARQLHKDFSSLSIEVFPMEIDEYKLMVNSGIDGLTIYQETYDKKIYSKVHPAGKKRNFNWRIDGPDRGGIAGFRKIGVGALLGLSDWRVEGFFVAMHALYLTKKYWQTQVQVSFPRLRYAEGGFQPYTNVTDRDLTHLIAVSRIILNDAALVLSTRESEDLRDNLLPIGITMMSAGSKTDPGGYSHVTTGTEQFEIEDKRTPDEISLMLQKKGFDPVWKDWDNLFLD